MPTLETRESMRTLILRPLSLFIPLTLALLFPEPTNAEKIDAIAKDIAADVGTVLEIFDKSSTNAPILLLDEVHNSRAVQIEHAIMLVRLYERYGLREIVLEGHLKTDPTLDTQWFDRASGGNQLRKARVAAQLLKEGEIGGAEFLALVYGDVVISPSEVLHEYNVELSENDNTILMKYLMTMAEMKGGTVSGPLMEDLKAASGKLNSAKASGDPAKIEPARAELTDRLDRVLRALASVDPWILSKYDELNKRQTKALWSLNRDTELARDIKRKTEQSGISLKPEDRKAMDSYLAFHEARANSSLTMAEVAISSAEKHKSPVALIMGAAHTLDVAELLRRRGQTFATVRPLSLKEAHSSQGDISPEAYKRKQRQWSLFSEGISEVLVKEFGISNNKRPKPVLGQPWLQAKAELYLFIETVVESTLDSAPPSSPPVVPPGAPPGAPPGGPPEGSQNAGSTGNFYTPPFGPFIGMWVAVDRKRAKIVGEGEKGKFYTLSDHSLEVLKAAGVDPEMVLRLEILKGYATESEKTFLSWAEIVLEKGEVEKIKDLLLRATLVVGVPAVVFPLVLHHDHVDKRREIWVKAARSKVTVSSRGRETVEAQLRRVWDEVKSERKVLGDRSEDPNGLVQTSYDTIASIVPSEELAETTSLFGG